LGQGIGIKSFWALAEVTSEIERVNLNEFERALGAGLKN